MTCTLHHGDCLEVLATLPDCSVDAIVTDPPAGIAFMGKAWDRDKGGKTEWLRDNTHPNFGVEWNPTTRGGHHVRNVVRDAIGWRGEVCLRPGGPRRGEPEDWQVEVWHSDGTYYGGSPKSEMDLVAINEGEGL